MPTEPLVSIVLPVCDGERWIGETLQSALAQSYHPIEIIVVDDGSRDRTREIAEAAAARDSRIRVIAQQNLGVAAARNRGIEVSRGEFVAPLDADDLWDPEKIAQQVRRMHAAGASSGLVYCWWVVIDAAGDARDSSPRWRIEGSGGRAADTLLQVNFTGNASVPLFRRDAIEKAGGYDATLRARDGQGCEDWDLALKIAERWSVAVVPAALVAYRKQPDTMSARRDRMWRSFQLMATAAAGRRAIAPHVLRRAYQQFALHLAGSAYWSGAHGEAIAWGLRALPSTLAIQIAPYVLRMLARQAVPPVRIEAGAPFDAAHLPEPLIPYDRFYGST